MAQCKLAMSSSARSGPALGMYWTSSYSITSNSFISRPSILISFPIPFYIAHFQLPLARFLIDYPNVPFHLPHTNIILFFTLNKDDSQHNPPIPVMGVSNTIQNQLIKPLNPTLRKLLFDVFFVHLQSPLLKFLPKHHQHHLDTSPQRIVPETHFLPYPVLLIPILPQRLISHRNISIKVLI